MRGTTGGKTDNSPKVRATKDARDALAAKRALSRAEMKAASVQLGAAFEAVSRGQKALGFDPRSSHDRNMLRLVAKENSAANIGAWDSPEEGLPALVATACAWLERNPKTFILWIQRRVRQKGEPAGTFLARLTPALVIRAMLRDWLSAEFRSEVEAGVSSAWRLYAAARRPRRQRFRGKRKKTKGEESDT